METLGDTIKGTTELGNAATDIITFTGKVAGTTSVLHFDGATVDTNYLHLAVADPGSAVTVTIPAETGTLLTTVSVSRRLFLFLENR